MSPSSRTVSANTSLPPRRIRQRSTNSPCSIRSPIAERPNTQISQNKIEAFSARSISIRFVFNAPATTVIYTLSLHDALPIYRKLTDDVIEILDVRAPRDWRTIVRSEEHTSELQSRFDLVCRLLLEKKNVLFEGRQIHGSTLLIPAALTEPQPRQRHAGGAAEH